MTRYSKILTIAFSLVVAGIGASLLLHRSSDNGFGQSVNAAIDNLVAVGIRLLELPVVMLLASSAILSVVMTLPIFRWGTRTGRITLTRAVVAALGGMMLVGLSLAADYKNERSQAEVSTLRGELNRERMARLDSPNNQVVASSGAVVATPAKSPPVTAKAVAQRDTLMVDKVQVSRNLVPVFGSVKFSPTILNDAIDVVEIDMQNPPVIAYMAIVNLRTPGVEIKCGGSLTQKTLTSAFARANNCQIAINGEAGNSPQANSGLGVWRGNLISAGQILLKEDLSIKRPFLAFDKQSHASFTALSATDRTIVPDAFNVIWGRLDAVINDQVQTQNERDRQPRTAMGLSKDGTKLYLLVVDGRQPNYSVGFTRAEVGLFLQAFGASNGMLCDEGGSSCFYVRKLNGIVNSPSDGGERYTYTHFGIALNSQSNP